jgi:DNA-binding response OmpR family regulator
MEPAETGKLRDGLCHPGQRYFSSGPQKREVCWGMIRVLLIEGEAGLLKLIAFLLRIQGFEVITAASEKEAHAAMSNGRFDLVIVDSALRGGDDVAAAAQRLGIHVILTSGDPYRIVQGPLPFIAKPFTGAELLKLMRALLRAPGPGAHSRWPDEKKAPPRAMH